MDGYDPLFDNSVKLSPDSTFGSKYLDPDYLFVEGVDAGTKTWNTVKDWPFYEVYSTITFFLSLFFTTIIIYSVIRIFEIRKKDHAHLHHEIHEYARKHANNGAHNKIAHDVSNNPAWRRILGLLYSPSASDWKLAVLEADEMLGELLSQMGFKGETIGEKLKIAGDDRFKNITFAWEAHSIRNRIAHEGSIFELSHHEAKRVVALYEEVFRAYGFI